MSDKPLTPHPPSSARRANPSEEERERERWRTYAEEIEREQRLAVPPWGFELATQITQVSGLVKATNESVGTLVTSVDKLAGEVASLTARVAGRHGVEDQLDKHRERTAQELQQIASRLAALEQWKADRASGDAHAERRQEDDARALQGVSARLATLEHWQAERDRADTIRISEAQRGWWDSALKLVGATLVGLALGGGAVGVTLARGCEPAPALVKGP